MVVWSDLCYPEDITELLIDFDEENETVEVEESAVQDDFADFLMGILLIYLI